MIRRAVMTLATLAVMCLCSSVVMAGMIEVSGNISSNTTWSSADTVHVTGTVTCQASVELTIGPGTIILFDPLTSLNVQGYLDAQGTAEDRIVFTSFTDGSGGDPEAGDWEGITFEMGSDAVMRNCGVSYAGTGLYILQASPAFDSCVVDNFLVTGFYINGSYSSPPITPVIENCTVRQRDTELVGTAVGIHIYRSVDAVLSRCLVADCATGIDFHGYGSIRPNFLVTDCEIRDHSKYGIYSHSDG